MFWVKYNFIFIFRIIEINGQSVVAVPHERIVNLLATSVGEVSSYQPSLPPTVNSSIFYYNFFYFHYEIFGYKRKTNKSQFKQKNYYNVKNWKIIQNIFFRLQWRLCRPQCIDFWPDRKPRSIYRQHRSISGKPQLTFG